MLRGEHIAAAARIIDPFYQGLRTQKASESDPRLNAPGQLQFAFAWRGPDPNSAVEEKYCRVMPHSGVLEDLQENPRAAIKYLEQEADHPSRTNYDATLFGSYVNAMLYFTLKNPAKRNAVLSKDFMDAFWRIVLDPERYDLLDAESDDVVIEPFPVITMYLVMRMFTVVLYVETLRARSGDRPADAAHNRRILDLYMPRFREFWVIVWENQYDLFHAEVHDHIYVYSAKPEGGSVRTVVIDCLLAMATFMDRLHGDQVTDRQALDVYLVAWQCANINGLTIEAKILERLSEDMQILCQTPNELSDWFASIDERDNLTAEETVDSVRATLLSRDATGEMVNAVLHVFFLVAAHPSVQKYTQDMVNKFNCPVKWVMKAIQRQLCARPETTQAVKDDVVAIGLGCLVLWCKSMRVDAMYMVQHRLGISFVPYLSNLAILTSAGSCVDLDMTLSELILAGVASAKVLGQNTVPLPFTQSNEIRRIWITTLQELRKYTGNSVRDQAVQLWLKLGRVHGFEERSELVWLKTHKKPAPVRPEGPAWSHCAWSGCMCYEQRPLYRLAACKGCLRAYYCGNECQKKDWLDGHRTRCLSRRR